MICNCFDLRFRMPTSHSGKDAEPQPRPQDTRKKKKRPVTGLHSAMRVQHHDLQRAADAAQIDQSVVVFLEAMKISNLGMLAAAADSFAEVDEQFWQKWCDGIISESKELKLTDDNMMTARAALRYLWKEANSSWPQDGHEFADPPSWQRGAQAVFTQGDEPRDISDFGGEV